MRPALPPVRAAARAPRSRRGWSALAAVRRAGRLGRAGRGTAARGAGRARLGSGSPSCPPSAWASRAPASRPARAALADALDVVGAARTSSPRSAQRASARRSRRWCWCSCSGAASRATSRSGLLAESLAYSTLQAGPEFAPGAPAVASGSGDEAAEPAVLARREGDELHLALNRPDKRNAFSAEMRDALCEALALVIQDASLRRVVLSGAGTSFCSGGDLDEFGTLPDPATAHAIRSTRNAAALLARVAERVEARVHGACVGAGAELPAFCRRVVADPGAFFQLPEVALGLVPGAGGTVSLPRRIGRQRTAWLALSGRRLPAEEALAWGLVDELAARRP